MVSDDRKHVYEVQHLATGETRDAHVVRLRFYADKDLEVSKRITRVFHHVKHQVEYFIESIGEVIKAERGDEYAVRVYWQG